MKPIRHILFIIFFGYLLFSADVLLANKNETISYYKNPKSIMNKISNRGSHAIVSELYSCHKAWAFVLQKIATGTKSWLRVAVALHSGADAGTSEMLALSVGEALENSPDNVFLVTLKEFRVESICSGPDIDNVRYNSYELAMKAIKQRQNRILAISDHKLKNVGEKCMQILEKSKDGIARFYGIGEKK
ncbi:MAG: hypothetical protein HY754_02055 [Nitrospirae bacterium]|nr:hypothetical protein [Nitrospirota bacterium]